MDLREISYEGVDWTYMAEDMDLPKDEGSIFP
jgi:hypothetical protein